MGIVVGLGGERDYCNPLAIVKTPRKEELEKDSSVHVRPDRLIAHLTDQEGQEETGRTGGQTLKRMTVTILDTGDKKKRSVTFNPKAC